MIWLFSLATLFHASVGFQPSSDRVVAYEPFEVVANIHGIGVANPFREIRLRGEFQKDGDRAIEVDGFCDSTDGSRMVIRYLPKAAGTYTYRIELTIGEESFDSQGSFTVVDPPADHPLADGMVQVDPEHPFHFLWSASGEHYYWNGATTYWMLGWQDESIIEQSIDRLARLKVNRIRVALCGRTTDGTRWDEPLVKNCDDFQFRVSPFVCARPESVEDPGYDVTRYDVAYWQKVDRLIRHAQKRGVNDGLR
jgi:hypothetical protein